ncbi:MAG: hypothetical protein ACD_52C00291G0002 [uncultured bacterium]|nr:MAG: hypothetical protein ACD_52C00291G0002 [uncultured bacterium]
MAGAKEISYRELGFDWTKLVSYSTWAWDAPDASGNLQTLISSDREARIKEEMTALIGKPSLEAFRYLWAKFEHSIPGGIQAVRTMFYYYHRASGKPERDEDKTRVVIPFAAAIDPEKLSLDWISDGQRRLESEWGRPGMSVAFGIATQVYSQDDCEVANSYMHEAGPWGEKWFPGLNNAVLHSNSSYSLVVADVDRPAKTEELEKASEILGAPFFDIRTQRGHHLIFPALIKSHPFAPDSIVTRVNSVVGLGLSAAGLYVDDNRHLLHLLQTGETCLRVSTGLNRPEIPNIAGVVWGNEVIRSPLQGV